MDRHLTDRLSRWLWAGWALSALLGFLAPWRRAVMGIPGSGTLPVQAAVVLMIAMMVIVRKRPQSFYSTLLMSAGGLTVGASLAFATLGFLNHRPLYELLALKWIFLGGVLTLAFNRQMRRAVAPRPEFEMPNLEGLSPEEVMVVMQERSSQIREESRRLRAHTNRVLLCGMAFLVLSAAVVAMAEKTDILNPAQRSFLYAGAGTVLLLVSAGAWKTSVPRPNDGPEKSTSRS